MAAFAAVRHDGRMADAQNAFDDALTRALAGLNVSLETAQLIECRMHFERVVEANRTINLTRITEPADAAVKHFADSLALLRWASERKVNIRTVLDVGTGAGFPAVPLAVARPDWKVTAIDGTAKKIAFLRSSVEAAGLTNLDCEHAHSTHWTPRRRFDLVTARALASLPRVLAQTAGFVEPGGWFVAYKTASVDSSEENSAEQVSIDHGLKLCERYAYDLDCGGDALMRSLYIYQRIA